MSVGEPAPSDSPQVQPADLAKRLGARVLDTAILGLPLLIAGLVIMLILGSAGELVWFVLFVGATYGYLAYFESTTGQTLGKQMLHLRVVGPDGRNPTRQQALKRNLLPALMPLGLLLVLLPTVLAVLLLLVQLGVLIWIAVTISKSPTKQGFHDTFAGGTYVIKTA